MATLSNVITTLRQEGELTRDTGENSLASLKEVFTTTIMGTAEGAGGIFSDQAIPTPGQIEDEPFGDTAKDEEEKKEQMAIFEKIADTLEGVGKQIESLSDSILDVVGKGAKTGGLLGLLTLFINPELAMKAVRIAIDVFNDAVTAFSGLLQGSTEGLKQFISNNPVVSAVGATLLVVKTVLAVRELLTSIGGAFTKIATTFGKISAFVGSIGGVGFLATVGGIALALYSFYDALKQAVDEFKESGSILAALRTLLTEFTANLIGIPLNFVKSTIAFIADLFGFDQLAEEIGQLDFKQGIRDGINMIMDAFGALFSYVGSIPEKILNWTKKQLAKLPFVGGLFETDASTDQDASELTNAVMSGTVDRSSTESAYERKKRRLDRRFNYLERKRDNAATQESMGGGDNTGTSQVAKSAVSDNNFISGNVRKLTADELTNAVRYTVNDINGNVRKLTADELTNAVMSGTVDRSVAKSAVESNQTRYTVNDINGNVRKLTADELTNAVMSGTVDRSVAKSAVSDNNFISGNVNLSAAGLTPVSQTTDLAAENRVSSSPFTRDMRIAQRENQDLTAKSSQSIGEELAPVLAALSQQSGGMDGNKNTAISNTTNISRPYVPDQLSREFIYKPS